MALTSACAVGSFAAKTVLTPSTTTAPSFTISAANGPPPPEFTFSEASRITRRINSGFARSTRQYRASFYPPHLTHPPLTPYPLERTPHIKRPPMLITILDL